MSKLTAWERWELASFDQPASAPPAASEAEPAAQASVEEPDQVRELARGEGYAAGYAAGRGAAQEEATRLGGVADELQKALTEFQQQVANELLALVIEIARQVVRREIAVRPDLILDVVREALAQLPHQHAVIYLSSRDIGLVRSHLGETLAHAGHRLHEDPQLQPGDCLIDTGGSQVDATLATRWRRVIESIGLESTWTEADKS